MSTIISASQVKELRERTGAGMMECKKALEASNGDMERAIEELRKSGAAKAGKKAGRIAAEGAIAITDNDKQAVMIEVNCETDFVARDSNFTSFVKAVAKTALETGIQDVSQLSGAPLLGHAPQTVEQVRQELVTKVGENVQVRRIVLSGVSAATIGTYLHGSRIGVMVELDVDNKDLARDIAMHIAASRPLVISPEDVSQELIAKEKEIYMAQAATSGKPQEIIEKMVAGRLKKFLDEVSLVGQPFVKDPDITVGGLLSKHRAKVLAFHRFEVGEGIEKASEDFKEAVMSQVQGS
ncbi:translation elongation factor Ts [Aquicella lusitana]|uniref:Elongation factor Ts n=1 Tax=Aquicella lusitana TaxID=254246 RepID=A0A370GF38_9COXI|nr:translation elongation factor Ts [Aquicella lusitana]RDI41806.1 translation elongation factor Ts (EF-Ts) [Aquicella lusitana]VVC73714.1 Elongation factor Ts [Aquicella lusitana]